MSGRELGRISGPLLANNLKRNGSNLAFDTKVLYLNVNGTQIGVNTNAPSYTLDINGAARTTNLNVVTQANLANLEFYTNNIQNVVGNITISPYSSGTTVVPQLQATNLLFSGNILSSTNANGNINIGLTGASTAQIKLNNSVLVSGNLHATGDITWDGNITLGNNVGVDTVTFDAEINSSIIPSANNTDNLGSPSYVWATTYANTVNATTTSATSLSTSSLTGSGTNNLNNNVTIGTTNANTLTINAELNTSLIPSVTNTDTLGSSTNLWNNIYGVTFLDGNITLTGNTIQTTTTNSSLQLKANGTGQVVMSAVNVTNNTTVGGTLSVTGTSTLTNTSAGAITEVGNISQTGNFTTTGTISSGSIDSTGTVTLPNITLSGSTITGTNTNSNLVLTAKSGQAVKIASSAQLDQNASITGTLGVTGITTLASTAVTGAITQTGDFNQTGNVSTTGNFSTNNIIFDGIMDYFDPGNFVINGNTITVSPTDGSMTFSANGIGNVWLGNDLKIKSNTIINNIGPLRGINFRPAGSGQVKVNSTRSIILPLGDDSKYPLTTNGEIRLNDVNLNVEGYSSSGYVNFINLYSQDHQTYISPESTPGAADNILRFAVGGTVTTTLTSSVLSNNNLVVNNSVNIASNTIKSINDSNDIAFYSSGNKKVNFNGYNYIVDSTINTPPSGVFTISPTGSGYVKILGSNGFGIPVGNNSNYPASPVTGTLRYNTTLSYPEIYNGSVWIPIYGTTNVPSATDVQDLVLVYELVLGF